MEEDTEMPVDQADSAIESGDMTETKSKGPRGRGRGRGGRDFGNEGQLSYVRGKMRGKTINGIGPMRCGIGRMYPYPETRGQRGGRGRPPFLPPSPMGGMMRDPFSLPAPRLILRTLIERYMDFLLHHHYQDQWASEAGHLTPEPEGCCRCQEVVSLHQEAFPMDLVYHPLRHLDGARDGLDRQVADTIKEAYSLNCIAGRFLVTLKPFEMAGLRTAYKTLKMAKNIN
ncbi:unnamed protein product [Lepidochelys kempii]